MRVNKASMEQRWNARARGTGDPQENLSTSGTVRHDSHMPKSGSDPNGNQNPSLPRLDASSLTTTPTQFPRYGTTVKARTGSLVQTGQFTSEKEQEERHYRQPCPENDLASCRVAAANTIASSTFVYLHFTDASMSFFTPCTPDPCGAGFCNSCMVLFTIGTTSEAVTTLCLEAVTVSAGRVHLLWAVWADFTCILELIPCRRGVCWLTAGDKARYRFSYWPDCWVWSLRLTYSDAGSVGRHGGFTGGVVAAPQTSGDELCWLELQLQDAVSQEPSGEAETEKGRESEGHQMLKPYLMRLGADDMRSLSKNVLPSRHTGPALSTALFPNQQHKQYGDYRIMCVFLMYESLRGARSPTLSDTLVLANPVSCSTLQDVVFTMEVSEVAKAVLAPKALANERGGADCPKLAVAIRRTTTTGIFSSCIAIYSLVEGFTGPGGGSLLTDLADANETYNSVTSVTIAATTENPVDALGIKPSLAACKASTQIMIRRYVVALTTCKPTESMKDLPLREAADATIPPRYSGSSTAQPEPEGKAAEDYRENKAHRTTQAKRNIILCTWQKCESGETVRPSTIQCYDSLSTLFLPKEPSPVVHIARLSTSRAKTVYCTVLWPVLRGTGDDVSMKLSPRQVRQVMKSDHGRWSSHLAGHGQSLRHRWQDGAQSCHCSELIYFLPDFALNPPEFIFPQPMAQLAEVAMRLASARSLATLTEASRSKSHNPPQDSPPLSSLLPVIQPIIPSLNHQLKSRHYPPTLVSSITTPDMYTTHDAPATISVQLFSQLLSRQLLSALQARLLKPTAANPVCCSKPQDATGITVKGWELARFARDIEVRHGPYDWLSALLVYRVGRVGLLVSSKLGTINRTLSRGGHNTFLLVGRGVLLLAGWLDWVLGWWTAIGSGCVAMVPYQVLLNTPTCNMRPHLAFLIRPWQVVNRMQNGLRYTQCSLRLALASGGQGCGYLMSLSCIVLSYQKGHYRDHYLKEFWVLTLEGRLVRQTSAETSGWRCLPGSAELQTEDGGGQRSVEILVMSSST
ncbi:hypothetical protein PR048_021663 [Dryococelus australis]|uniref:Uncharacterized protein n=1 Tax=Dryococelus australis TaxID=614101 RepID=A0ABQ9GYT9_9NEOP|nr:hypothetical protein PR048_021663 [Dryococelus australis]